MSDKKGVLVIAEQHNGRLDEACPGVLFEGRRLADKLGGELSAVLIGAQASMLIDSMARYGADILYLLDSAELADYTGGTAEVYARVVSDAALQNNPGIILLSSNAMGQDLAPRLAARMRTGLVLDCIDLKLRDDVLVQTKAAWGGKVYTTQVCRNGNPQICAIKPGAVDIARPDTSRKAKVFEQKPPTTGSRIKLTRSFRLKGEALSLTEADILVSGGRGVESKENWKLIEELAQVLGGVVAGSQAAVDAGFIPYAKQVGLSGKTVAPKLYIACGISGATHHLMGMRESGTIIAINKDRGAPIFKAADVSVLGDLTRVIPPLVRKLRAISKAGTASPAADVLKELGS
ncbi:MAG: electron transfer flavoprotein subunit alpha/FixB family protein [Chloroflexi bacterium]|nr:electron transfer flavoprotein subunit alpha/FixB family protein [Chloroflexota bacterium]